MYAIRDSVIPVVSAIGHETDVTLADFVADVRASTPTAAALYVVPVRADLINATESYAIRLCSAMCGLLRHHHQLYYHLQARLPSQAFQFVDHRKHLKRIEHVLKTSFLIALSQHERHAQMLITRLHKHSPLNLLHYQRTRVAHDWSMLTILVLKHMGNRKLDLNQYARGLTYVFVQTQQRVRHTIRMQRQHLDSLWKGCERRFGYVIETRIEWLSRAQDLLMTLNVEGLLARGFSLVKNAEGAYCSRKQSITLGECLTVRFIDGELKAKVIDLGEPTFDREG